MHNIPFYKLSPSGNMTILFDGLYHSTKERENYATQSLLPSHIGAEQAGFVDIDKGILEMAGGEFCINATRCLALLMALKENFTQEHTWSGSVHTAEFSNLPVQVKLIHDLKINNYYNVELTLPLPTMPPITSLDLGIELVNLPGISHILIDQKKLPFCAKDWKNQSESIIHKFDLEQTQALGCIWWEQLPKHNQQSEFYNFFIHPIVCVKKPFAQHYENACGSGSLALTLYQYAKTKKTNYIIQQPGGYLTLNLQEDIQDLKATIGGPVALVAKGQACFN